MRVLDRERTMKIHSIIDEIYNESIRDDQLSEGHEEDEEISLRYLQNEVMIMIFTMSALETFCSLV